MVASPLCQDVPGFVFVALEILDPAHTADGWRTWLERLMLIHTFERARERRGDDATSAALLDAFRRPRRP